VIIWVVDIFLRRYLLSNRPPLPFAEEGLLEDIIIFIITHLEGQEEDTIILVVLTLHSNLHQHIIITLTSHLLLFHKLFMSIDQLLRFHWLTLESVTTIPYRFPSRRVTFLHNLPQQQLPWYLYLLLQIHYKTHFYSLPMLPTLTCNSTTNYLNTADKKNLLDLLELFPLQ